MKLALVLSLFFVALPAADASTRAAHINFPSLSPVTVRGTGFRPSERVAVTVSAKQTRTKTVTATRFGSFRVTFPGLSIGHCEAFGASAKGNRGSRTSFKVIPECPAPGPSG